MAYSFIKSKHAVKPEGYKPKDTKHTEDFRKLKALRDAGETGTKEYKKLRDKLSLANLPLATKIAKRYRNQWLPHVPLEDVIHTAFTGILQAIDSYDPDVSAFSAFGGLKALFACQTYAASEGAEHDGRAPAKAEVFKRLKAFRMLNGREPTREELGVDEKVYKVLHRPHVEHVRLDSLSQSHGGSAQETTYDEDDNIPGESLDGEVSAIASEILESLPEDLREIFELSAFCGMTPRQIAREQGKKLKDVEPLLGRLREFLEAHAR